MELKEEEVPYRAVLNLGFGGHGFVEKVKDTITGIYYARKTIRLDRLPLGQAKDMLRREVEIVRELAPHPHIIRIHATYVAVRNLAIILQPVADRGDLAQFFSCCKDLGKDHSSFIENGRILRRAFGCLSRCLAYMHSKDFGHKPMIRHKDIKPKNILLHKGYAMFTDFGTSRRCTDDITTTTRRPESLTARYCAPEVADHEDRNRKADVFSLGCVFLEMLAVILPLPPALDNLLATDIGPYHERIEQLQQLIDDSSLMSRLIKRMLQRDIVLRPSADEVMVTLAETGLSKACSKCEGESSSARLCRINNEVIFLRLLEFDKRPAPCAASFAARQKRPSLLQNQLDRCVGNPRTKIFTREELAALVARRTAGRKERPEYQPPSIFIANLPGIPGNGLHYSSTTSSVGRNSNKRRISGGIAAENALIGDSSRMRHYHAPPQPPPSYPPRYFPSYMSPLGRKDETVRPSGGLSNDEKKDEGIQ